MKTMCAIAALAAGVSCAQAELFQWDFARGMPGSYGLDDSGGRIQTIRSTFDSVTQDFSWEVTFSNAITKGFWLAVSPGENPKGHAGELALMYLDVTQVNDPRLTIYNYNGVNGNNSYKDGSPASGNQAPDRILTSVSPAFNPTFSRTEAAGSLTLGISFNAAAVNAHAPVYPAANGDEWTGVAFGSKIGVWFHPVANLSTSYDANGWLTNFNGTQGWLDGNNFNTVPTPGAFALAGAAGLMLARRRR